MSNFSSENSTIDECAEIPQGNYTQNRLFQAVSETLGEVIKENTGEKIYTPSAEPKAKVVFEAKRKPSISLLDYILRIAQYAKFEDSTFILALIYIDRICDRNSILLTERNIHRLLFASLLLAIKYNEDDYYDNEYYAKVAGISTVELNRLEYEFLQLSDFSLYVPQEVYARYNDYLLHYFTKDF